MYKNKTQSHWRIQNNGKDKEVWLIFPHVLQSQQPWPLPTETLKDGVDHREPATLTVLREETEIAHAVIQVDTFVNVVQALAHRDQRCLDADDI